MQQLHPRAVWLFFLKHVWSFIVIVFILMVYIPNVRFLVMENGPTLGDATVGFRPLVFFSGLAFALILAYLWARLSYHFYRYEIREDSFRREHGVIWKQYVSIPYERIQNVDIYRGLIARILGLSDIHIQTAGMSYAGFKASEGRLPGLSREVAEQLRDELVKRARSTRGQGL